MHAPTRSESCNILEQLLIRAYFSSLKQEGGSIYVGTTRISNRANSRSCSIIKRHGYSLLRYFKRSAVSLYKHLFHLLDSPRIIT